MEEHLTCVQNHWNYTICFSQYVLAYRFSSYQNSRNTSQISVVCISLLETCTFCHTWEADGFFRNMLTLYSFWVLLKSHTKLVHQNAILERHCQSYMWMGQQGTGDVHYCAYLLCLHTCSFVPLDLTSSRIKFLKISKWQ